MAKPLIRAVSVAAAGAWSGDPADSVVLDHDRRQKRRFALTGTVGLAFLVDLAEAPSLRDGDGLVLEDGRIVRVVAAAEDLAEITARDPLHLARLAWHLGNRHLATEIGDRAVRIRADHVIEDMARRLGAHVRHVRAPFEPEAGAYGGHSDGHAHDAGRDRHHG